MSEVETSPLLARIEEIAARAAQDVEAELSLASEVYAVRADVSRLAARLDGELRSPLEARLAALEDSLEGVAERLEAFARDGASVTTERLTALGRDLAEVRSAIATGGGEMQTLISERTADSAAELLEAQRSGVTRVDAAVSALTLSVRESMAALSGSVEASLTALGGSIGAALAEARDAHHDHLDEISGFLDTATEGITSGQSTQSVKLAAQGTLLDELRLGVAVTNTAIDGLASKVAAIGKTAADNGTTLARIGAGLSDVTKQVVKEAQAAAAAEVEAFRTKMDQEIRDLRETLQATAATVVDSRQELVEGTHRLETAGQALLQYLGERDLSLEEERDRLLRDILDEFAKGLDSKSRKHLSARVGEALERSRDARDADRYRRTRAGEQAVPVPLVVSAEPDSPGSERPVATGLMRPADQQRASAPARSAKPPVKRASSAPATVPATRATPSRGAAKPAAKPAVKAAAKPAVKAAGAAAPKAASKSGAPKAKKPASPVAPKPAAEKARPKPKSAASAERDASAPAPAASEPAAPVAAVGSPAARRPRAAVDTMPEVASPSSAIDAAAGEEDGVPAGTAVDAFTAASSSRRRPFGGRRSRS